MDDFFTAKGAKRFFG